MKCLIAILFFLSFIDVYSQQMPGAGNLNLSSELQSLDLEKVAVNRQDFKYDRNSTYVFVFLSPECPLCINYTKTLNALSNQYGKLVKFVGIVPGKAYSRKAIRNFRKEYKVSFDIFTDPVFKLSSLLNATVTPEVVLLSKDATIAYRGAIDDWAISLGKKKIKPTNLYLQSAIEQQLLGQDIVIKQTNPVGCLINDF